MRLLPKDPEIGWTPYAWLVYLGSFVGAPFLFSERGTVDWLVVAAGVAIFLPLYFAGFWCKGARLRWVIVAITVLGVVLSPLNPGATVFFIYSSAFVARAAPPRSAVVGIFSLLGLVALEAWIFDVSPFFWIPAVVFTPLIGGINVFFYQLSNANAKLRRSQSEIERLATAAERERIARDLHDLLGHTLSLITLKAELASKLSGKDPESAAREIREVEAISRQALKEVREAVTGYHRTDLAAEIVRARLALDTAGIALTLEQEPVDLSGAAENVLGLALREAVANTVRHSRASTCRITIHREGDTVLLEIADDGRGGPAVEGAGLKGMRERVAALGGEVERPDRRPGTTLHVRLPSVDPRAHQEAVASDLPTLRQGAPS